jgi:hypothetical protein
VGADGLVDYDGYRMSPKDALSKFLVDYPMFVVLRAEVCERLDKPNPVVGTSYTWVEIERFV